MYASSKSTAVPLVVGLIPVAVTPSSDEAPPMLYVTTTSYPSTRCLDSTTLYVLVVSRPVICAVYVVFPDASVPLVK